MFKFYQDFSGFFKSLGSIRFLVGNLIKPKLYRNPTKNLIDPKLYIMPTKNLIELKLYMNPTKSLVMFKFYQDFSGVL
jgi:hypothetical protein